MSYEIEGLEKIKDNPFSANEVFVKLPLGDLQPLLVLLKDSKIEDFHTTYDNVMDLAEECVVSHPNKEETFTKIASEVMEGVRKAHNVSVRVEDNIYDIVSTITKLKEAEQIVLGEYSSNWNDDDLTALTAIFSVISSTTFFNATLDLSETRFAPACFKIFSIAAKGNNLFDIISHPLI